MQVNTFRMVIAYNGSHFFGWQKTKEGPSIENTLLEALDQLHHKAVDINVSSRTDRGVHAKEQICQITLLGDCDLRKSQRSLNALLKNHCIAIVQIEIADNTYNARLSPRIKEYRYLFTTTSPYPWLKQFVWEIPPPFDLDLARMAIPLFVGDKDYSFCTTATYSNPTCSIYDIQIDGSNDLYSIQMVGNRFLYKMARIISGFLIAKGQGKNPTIHTKITAPAYGLHLSSVYEKNHFSCLNDPLSPILDRL
jgi:tRNA pseudouridine38-40 synthase